MRRTVPPAEVVVDARLARRLLRAQHPDLAGLPLRRIGTGWDNVVFRLGSDLCVRMPRRELGAQLIATEARWLPSLATGLPLQVPTPLRTGEPGEGYPWHWTVCTYVPGRPLGAQSLRGDVGLRAAEDLARFLTALHLPAPAGAPANPYRGVPLGQRDDSVAPALAECEDMVRPRLEQVWWRAVAAPGFAGRPSWLHGDLHSLNVLVDRGRVTGVIDFGDMCAGDPATDVSVAWLVLDRDARALFRRRAAVDHATWQRARGWALFFGLMFAQHSVDAPVNASIGRRVLQQVLVDD